MLGATEDGRRLDVANFNSFDQTVIAGPKADLAAVSAGVRIGRRPRIHSAQRERALPFALHARADAEFGGVPGRVLVRARQRFRSSPTSPLSPTPPTRCARRSAKQIGHSVRWLDSMLYLLDQGVTEFEEVGPGTVLGKLAQRIRKARAD